MSATALAAHSEVIAIVQGPLLGTLATMLFYGIICMQVFFYAQNYPKDRRIIKSLVAVIWALETAHTGLSIHFIEHYLIDNFSNPGALPYAVWSMPATYFVGFFIAYLANLCFIWRIWLLSKKFWLAICLGVLATVRLGFGLTNCSLSFHYIQWKSFRQHVYPTMITGWALSVVVDSLIAWSLCYYLHKRRTGMNQTDSLINHLLLYTINTGALTSFFAILVIITFLVLSSSLAFIGFVQVQSKFYAISLLATLNTRKSTGSTSSANRDLASTFDNINVALMNVSLPKSNPASPNSGREFGTPGFRSGHHTHIPTIEIKQTQQTDIFTDSDITYHGNVLKSSDPYGINGLSADSA